MGEQDDPAAFPRDLANRRKTRSMRVASVTRPLFMGMLRSTRRRTGLPRRSPASSRVRKGVGGHWVSAPGGRAGEATKQGRVVEHQPVLVHRQLGLEAAVRGLVEEAAGAERGVTLTVDYRRQAVEGDVQHPEVHRSPHLTPGEVGPTDRQRVGERRARRGRCPEPSNRVPGYRRESSRSPARASA